MSAFERLRRGDRQAFDDVVAEYAAPAYALAAAILGEGPDAERVAAEVMLDAWEFGAALPTLPAAERLWVLALVRRAAVDRQRKRKRPRDEDAGFVPLIALAVEDPTWQADLTLLTADDVREALEILPAETRETLDLAHAQGLRPGEIARRMKLSEETVRERLRFGLQQLRDALTPAAVARP
ncbi:MAG: RNA polymerase sigma factor [Dehalococcoidia bacterium]|nr:RNA polymerase sigma factor [Dehalococcoidia bacterium]